MSMWTRFGRPTAPTSSSPRTSSPTKPVTWYRRPTRPWRVVLVKKEKRVSAMPLREFGSVNVGDQLPEKIYPLTRQDLVNYAGVSGDSNPIHRGDEDATSLVLA